MPSLGDPSCKASYNRRIAVFWSRPENRYSRLQTLIQLPSSLHSTGENLAGKPFVCTVSIRSWACSNRSRSARITTRSHVRTSIPS